MKIEDKNRKNLCRQLNTTTGDKIETLIRQQLVSVVKDRKVRVITDRKEMKEANKLNGSLGLRKYSLVYAFVAILLINLY